MKRFKFLAGILGAGFLLTACLSFDDDYNHQQPQEVGYLAFINASPDSEDLKFYSGTDLINQTPLDYGEFINYIYHNTGNISIRTKAGNSEYLDTLNFNLQKDKLHSIYAINEVDDLKLMIYNDDHFYPEIQKSMIRFIQLSPDAPHLRIAIEGSEQDLGEYHYTETSPFMEIDPAIHKYMYLIDEVTSDTLFSKKVNFAGGKSYSVFSKGFIDTTVNSQKLDIQAIPFQ